MYYGLGCYYNSDPYGSKSCHLNSYYKLSYYNTTCTTPMYYNSVLQFIYDVSLPLMEVINDIVITITNCETITTPVYCYNVLQFRMSIQVCPCSSKS